LDPAESERLDALLRALTLCATGATIHRLNNVRLTVTGYADILKRNPNDEEAKANLENAMRRARQELAAVVWSRS